MDSYICCAEGGKSQDQHFSDPGLRATRRQGGTTRTRTANFHADSFHTKIARVNISGGWPLHV